MTDDKRKELLSKAKPMTCSSCKHFTYSPGLTSKGECDEKGSISGNSKPCKHYEEKTLPEITMTLGNIHDNPELLGTEGQHV